MVQPGWEGPSSAGSPLQTTVVEAATLQTQALGLSEGLCRALCILGDDTVQSNGPSREAALRRRQPPDWAPADATSLARLGFPAAAATSTRAKKPFSHINIHGRRDQKVALTAPTGPGSVPNKGWGDACLGGGRNPQVGKHCFSRTGAAPHVETHRPSADGSPAVASFAGSHQGVLLQRVSFLHNRQVHVQPPLPQSSLAPNRIWDQEHQDRVLGQARSHAWPTEAPYWALPAPAPGCRVVRRHIGRSGTAESRPPPAGPRLPKCLRAASLCAEVAQQNSRPL